jgi:hypothetical protein
LAGLFRTSISHRRFQRNRSRESTFCRTPRHSSPDTPPNAEEMRYDPPGTGRADPEKRRGTDCRHRGPVRKDRGSKTAGVERHARMPILRHSACMALSIISAHRIHWSEEFRDDREFRCLAFSDALFLLQFRPEGLFMIMRFRARFPSPPCGCPAMLRDPCLPSRPLMANINSVARRVHQHRLDFGLPH